MNTRTNGYAMIAVLLIGSLTVMMSTTMLMGAMNGVTRTGLIKNAMQARTTAESGQASINYNMNESITTQLNIILAPYTQDFAQSKNRADMTAIIPTSAYSTIERQLNTLPESRAEGEVNSGQYTAQVNFRNFRADTTSFTNNGQNYHVDYSTVSVGTVGKYRRNVNSEGSLKIRLGRQYLNQFLILANDGGSATGNYFGTGMEYDGPVQINKNWMFAGTPKFRMGARTADPTVKMYNCSNKSWVPVNTQTYSCTTPDWGGYGIQYGAQTVDLPSNAYSQSWAALGGDPTMTGEPTNLQVCAAILATNCNAGVPRNGVYMPSGGGIYIQGDAAVRLSVDGKTQVYTVTVNGATTTIRVTNPSGPTTYSGPLGTWSRPGVPNGQLYVKGTVTSLTGGGRPAGMKNPTDDQISPAIASDTQMNVAASGDIVIQGDLKYETDPRVTPQAKNILGIISGSGSVRVGTSAPDNVRIQGAILAGATGKGLSVDNYNSGVSRGSIQMLGSIAENLDPPRGVGTIVNGKVSITRGYGDAFSFDQRFLNGSAIPPYYPATTLFTTQSSLPRQTTWREN